jgi:hypothetical protein
VSRARDGESEMPKVAATQPAQATKKPRVARAKSEQLSPVASDAASAQGLEPEAVAGDRQVVGLKLINLVRKTLIDRNLPERHVADLMGITQIYWNSMTNGNRRISSLPKDKLQRLAEFLEVPLIQVYVLADHFTAEDFVVYKSLPGDLERMIEFMRSDPTWLAFAPSKKEWSEMSTRAKVLVAALYERLIHKSFLRSSKVEIPRQGEEAPADI